jgi:lambda family phage portal protein
MATFDAANNLDKAMMLWSAESETLDQDLRSKDAIEARAYDLYRNNPTFRGLIEKQVDSVVGRRVLLQSMPDYEALGVSREDAMAWSMLVEREHDRYANSPENWYSADRSMDQTQMLRSAYRTKLLTGEMLSSREWRQSPLTYNTCFGLISPSRLKTPSRADGPDNPIFHGIEFDEYGAAIAYHIDEAVRNQRRTFGRRTSKRYGRYNDFNWLQIYHLYEPLKPEYPRGISRTAAIIKDVVQIGRYAEADLDKNIIAANYVFAVTSDEDPESVAAMLSGASSAQTSQFAVDAGVSCLSPEMEAKQQEILNAITDRIVELKGGKIMHLFNGETVQILQAPSATQTSSDYIKGALARVANGQGMSYEIATSDYSGVSFSGGQLSSASFDIYCGIERDLYAYKQAKLWFRTWLDEAMLKGTIPTLGGKDYWPNREAYSRCDFTGAEKIHADQLKHERYNAQRFNNGTTSRTQLANEAGVDIDKVITERASDANKMLAAIVSVAETNQVTFSPDAMLKIISEMITGTLVSLPDALAEVVQP